MAPGPIVNVVRYSALAGGILYGIVHRRTLQKNQEAAVVKEHEHQREKWLEEARKEWQKKQDSPIPSLSGLLDSLKSLA